MTNEELSIMLNAMVRALDGTEVQGGCTECEAHVRINADRFGGGQHDLNIWHQDDCPAIRRMIEEDA